jgi:hypothetical protein
MTSTIQSVLFDKTIWSLDDAKKWLRQHRIVPIKKVHSTKYFYRFRIKEPNEFIRFITKKIAHGVELVIGFRS